MTRLFRKLSQRGAAKVEYSVVLSLVVLGVIVSVKSIGADVTRPFCLVTLRMMNSGSQNGNWFRDLNGRPDCIAAGTGGDSSIWYPPSGGEDDKG